MRASLALLVAALLASFAALVACRSTAAPSNTPRRPPSNAATNANSPVLGNSPTHVFTAPANGRDPASTPVDPPTATPADAPTPVKPRAPLAADIPPADPVDLPWAFCVVYGTLAGHWLGAEDTEPYMRYALDRTIAHLTKRTIKTISYERELAEARAVIDDAIGDYGLNDAFLIPADLFLEINVGHVQITEMQRVYSMTATVIQSSSSRIWAMAVAESDAVTNELAGLAQATDRAIAAIIPQFEAEKEREKREGREFRVVANVSQSDNPDALVVFYDALRDACRDVNVISWDANKGEFGVWVDPALKSIDLSYQLAKFCETCAVAVSENHIFRQVLILDVR